MNDRAAKLNYLLSDWIFSLLAWNLFNLLRYAEFGINTGFHSVAAYLLHEKALLLDVVIPTFWILLSALCGYYHQPRRKNIGGDLLYTLVICILGVLGIFFTVIINDLPSNYTQYYRLFVSLFVLQFMLMILPRILLTSRKQKQHLQGCNGIPTLVIGSGKEAEELLRQYALRKRSTNDWIKGCIQLENESTCVEEKDLSGHWAELSHIVKKENIEHFIIAVDSRDEAYLQQLIDQLYGYRLEMHQFSKERNLLKNDIALASISGIPLRRITPAGMYPWEKNLKRLFDVTIACIALVLLSPLLLFLMIRVKLDSPGSVFYLQERLGKDAKPFKIIKFRTMYQDAEKNGPQLSSSTDTRITSFGVTMRRYRLDELPQLINVIKGDMALVGPRPERPFYAKQLLEKAPHYELVYSVRPGITSLGMAKYGYANSVDKMLQRLDYDMLYLKQASLMMDLKILIFTIKPLVSGSGV